MNVTSRQFDVRNRYVQSGFLLLCTAGSSWAMLGTSGCSACEQVKRLTGPIYVALLGLVLFFVLLGLTHVRRFTGQVRGLIFLAAGVYLVLLGILFAQRTICPSCIVTALSALAMAVWLLSTVRKRLVSEFILIVTGGAVGLAGMSITTNLNNLRQERAARAAAVAVAQEYTLPSRGQQFCSS